MTTTMTTPPPREAPAQARALFDRFTMGMVQTLEECEHVVDIRSKPAVPCTSSQIATWESTHTHRLPTDVKDFYLSSNGLQIAWTVLFGQQILPLGWLHINALGDLKPVSATSSSATSMAGTSKARASKLPEGVEEFLKSTSVADDTLTIKRRRHMPFRAFALSPCGTHATVCLTFTHPSPSIWLLDRSKTWHMIARTFTEYYRLMTLYLGLPEWQYALTTLGPLPDTRRWLHAFVPPHVLRDNAHESGGGSGGGGGNQHGSTRDGASNGSAWTVAGSTDRSVSPQGTGTDHHHQHHQHHQQHHQRQQNVVGSSTWPNRHGSDGDGDGGTTVADGTVGARSRRTRAQSALPTSARSQLRGESSGRYDAAGNGAVASRHRLKSAAPGRSRRASRDHRDAGAVSTTTHATKFTSGGSSGGGANMGATAAAAAHTRRAMSKLDLETVMRRVRNTVVSPSKGDGGGGGEQQHQHQQQQQQQVRSSQARPPRPLSGATTPGTTRTTSRTSATSKQ
ncbi:hypothetical protein PTSG_05856 [Salpingoeca rosetta]|uniref:Knr4/Smi1-like domain-containing protein n=1 Tax=Salpingoeca rosetta (strain ATCC 50818 / BSB-021) TaxID=946362 RepID=F2UCZ7_SALR5|nr:uncharacterized protein PTSG_05856 [Salpingoeca rosetta]EGD74492.1 hypothetical protein PTSG_05856 [Salpingoeca rosetta]|eukprot:XP_004992749.1 hypothetical protein PTSG_05856 [Salpingoeca rosetta]